MSVRTVTMWFVFFVGALFGTSVYGMPILVTTGAGPGNRDNFNGTVGTRFTVGVSDITVDALGYQDPGGDGLVLAHNVGLWRVSDQALVASVTVPAGSGSFLDDAWRYEPIGARVTLSAGQTYVVGAQVFSGSGDGWTDDAGSPDFALGAGVVDANPTNNFVPNVFGFPNNDGTLADLRWAPANVNALFGPPLPGPTADAALIPIGSPPGNRDNFTGTVASAFTVDDVRLINALGYQDPGGDGLAVAHQVGLWEDDGTLITSVTVPAADEALFVDEFRYVELPAEIVLMPGQTYIVGAEVFSNSGDGWTDSNTTASFVLDTGLLDTDPTNRFVAGSFGFPINNGGGGDLRWAPGNVAFISTPPAVPEPATVTLAVLSVAALLRRRRAA